LVENSDTFETLIEPEFRVSLREVKAGEQAENMQKLTDLFEQNKLSAQL